MTDLPNDTPARTSGDDAARDAVARACRMIESSDHLPSLRKLSAAAGLSESHFHRTFKRVTGLTPRGYAAEVRAGRVRERLRDSATVTEVIHEAGFGSSSRFYEGADGVLGMKPAAFRQGGSGVGITYSVSPCSLGLVLVATSETGVCAILLGDDADTLVADLESRFPRADIRPAGSEAARTIAAVTSLLEDPCAAFDLPLDIRGTAFQRRVWEALRAIPPGATLSYAQVAERIGSPNATRAVAGACAANSLAVAIPCHRVVRSDGGVSGYRWGVERKRALLKRERDCERG